VGDTSDNIPGVYGIGEKTAVKLLQTYKNLEGVYKNIGDIQTTVAEKLKHDKEKAFFSRELATIDRNVPIDFNLDKAKTHDFKIEQILELFENLQFYSLMRRLREWKKIPEPERKKVEPKPVAKEQMSLF
jgi:DNA polymerase-1